MTSDSDRTPSSLPAATASATVGTYLYPAEYDRPAREFSLVALLNELLRHRRLIAVVTGIFLILGMAGSFLTRKYIAGSVFRPEISDDSNSKLAGLAAQFGFTFGSSGSGESVQFYSQLARSREILETVAQTGYQFPKGSDPADSLHGTFIALYKIDGDTPTEQLASAVIALQDMVTATPDLDAGTVDLLVTTKWAGLSEQVTRRILDLVNQFNLERRQSQARAERVFTESRVQDAERELEAARQRYERFLEENRTFSSSPRLSFESDRLKSDIDFRQQVFTNLAQAYEQARIEEVRNTPVLTIIDRPEGSAIPDGKLFGAGLLGLILGGMLSVAYVLGRLYVRRLRIDSPGEFEEFAVLRRSAWGDVSPRQIWRRLKAGRSTPGG